MIKAYSRIMLIGKTRHLKLLQLWDFTHTSVKSHTVRDDIQAITV